MNVTLPRGMTGAPCGSTGQFSAGRASGGGGSTRGTTHGVSEREPLALGPGWLAKPVQPSAFTVLALFAWGGTFPCPSGSLVRLQLAPRLSTAVAATKSPREARWMIMGWLIPRRWTAPRRSVCSAAMLRGALLILAVLGSLGLAACSGTVEQRSSDDEGTGGATGGSGGSGASGGTPTGGTGGASPSGGAPSGGTGGTPDYVDPGCPDEPPPAVVPACDPLNPEEACGIGWACYPYVIHPYGTGCGYQQFGAECAPAGSGESGDACGDGFDDCAPGHLCVVGAGAGKRCQKLCPLQGDPGCPPGLLCGETDIEGYGVCF